MALALLAGLVAALTPGAGWAQQIWLGPRALNVNQPAAADWNLLFAPNPDWHLLARQINVFLIPTNALLLTPPAQLRAMEASLARHHIALAMPVQSVLPPAGATCGHQEGYADAWVAPKLIAKLRPLGVRLDILRLDGPLWFGHYATGPGSCHLPIPVLARQVAAAIAPYLAAYPHAELGDVEGPQALAQHPHWQANYLAFKRALEADTGRKLAFLQADVNWREPDWPTALSAEATFAHRAGMKFGIIYDSDSLARSSADWVARARVAFDQAETLYHLIPDAAVFQTWNEIPDHIFPETAPGAQSRLVALYLRPRTALSLTRQGRVLRGRLTAAGAGVAGANVRIDALGTAPGQAPPLRVAQGRVPAKARFAILGLRVNSECLCAGDNNLLFGTLSYQETAGGADHAAKFFMPPPHLAPGVRLRPEVIGGAPLLHLRVGPDAAFGFNSRIFPVTPGARFRFSVPLGTLNGRGLFGTATLIWLDAQQHGLFRTNITLGADAHPVATARTDAGGGFTLQLPAGRGLAHQALRAFYPGSHTTRAAYAALP